MSCTPRYSMPSLTRWPHRITTSVNSRAPRTMLRLVTSDVNKTFLSRPRPRLWTSRPIPRPRLFSQYQGRTLLGRPLNRLPYIFAILIKWTQQYTHNVTRHTDAEAPTFHFSGVPRIFEWGWGANRGEWEIFCIFFVVNTLFLRILAHFFHKPHCLSWQMN